jgi:flagellar protein FliO/FliZ
MDPVLGLRVLLALACVIGLIWVLARRAGWGKGASRPAGPTVEVVGRQALGRHAGVAVVAVGNRRLLLGYGEQQITMLTELAPAPADVVEDGAEAPARTPSSLAELAAAVLPSPRRARKEHPSAPAAAPAEPATAVSFAEVHAEALAEVAALPTEPVDRASAEVVAVATVPAVPAVAEQPVVTDVPVARGALHGSVLAPSTWSQAVAALRERTVRR